MTLDRELITSTALSLLKPRVKFKPYGRNPKYGFDCIGVVTWVGKQCGYLPADYKLPLYAYPPQPELFEHFNEMAVRRDGPEAGCIAIFAPAGLPQHSGIVVQADGQWQCIGIDLYTQHRPWVTISPLDQSKVWRFYDYVAQS